MAHTINVSHNFDSSQFCLRVTSPCMSNLWWMMGGIYVSAPPRALHEHTGLWYFTRRCTDREWMKYCCWYITLTLVLVKGVLIRSWVLTLWTCLYWPRMSERRTEVTRVVYPFCLTVTRTCLQRATHTHTHREVDWFIIYRIWSPSYKTRL